MASIKTITIKNPCSQSWMEMPPDHNGRYCNICTKTVIDFTIMSPDEIISYLAINQHSCGRVAGHQLEKINEQIATPDKCSLSMLKKCTLAIAILSSIGNFRAKAQAKSPMTIVKDMSVTGNPKPSVPVVANNDSLIIISGKLVDENNQSVIGAVIIDNSNKYHATTNEEGIFTLSIPRSTDSLTINSIGYQQKVIAIDASKPYLDTVIIKEESKLMGLFTINPPKESLFNRFIKWLSGKS